MTHLHAGNGTDPPQPRPDLAPTGECETDLTQLVTLIENVAPDGPDQAATPGLQDVVEFAWALRTRWERES